MTTKILMDTLRLADGGKVECSVAAPDGTVMRGVITESFFEDFTGVQKPVMTPSARGRIVQQNLAYLEGVADEQWRAGMREMVIS